MVSANSRARSEIVYGRARWTRGGVAARGGHANGRKVIGAGMAWRLQRATIPYRCIADAARSPRIPPFREVAASRRRPLARPARVEVAPGIHWLRMPLPFALDHINLWLLAEDDGYTLVDCGYGDATTRALWERHFATTLVGSRSAASSRRTAIPTISAMRRGSPRASAAPSR